MTNWKEVSPYTGLEIDEDAPASSAGGGNIAGIGIDHPDRPGSGEPGVDRKKKKKTLIDGRTKNYKIHRRKLETARQRRIEKFDKTRAYEESILGRMREFSTDEEL